MKASAKYSISPISPMTSFGSVRNYHMYLRFHSSLFMKQAFDFPADVSLSFGGPRTSSVWVMEMHYDNPAMRPGKLLLNGGTYSLVVEAILYVGRCQS